MLLLKVPKISIEKKEQKLLLPMPTGIAVKPNAPKNITWKIISKAYWLARIFLQYRKKIFYVIFFIILPQKTG